MDFADVLARKEPVTHSVPVVLNSAARARLIEAQDAHSAALRRSDTRADQQAAVDVAKAAQDLEDAQREAREHTVWFRFAALGRQPFSDLRGAHPPTEAQRKDYRARLLASGLKANEVGTLAWNPDTFPPALIAASCIDPKMAVEQAQEMWNSDRFSDAELAEIFDAALQVNQVNRRVELGEG